GLAEEQAPLCGGERDLVLGQRAPVDAAVAHPCDPIHGPRAVHTTSPAALGAGAAGADLAHRADADAQHRAHMRPAISECCANEGLVLTEAGGSSEKERTARAQGTQGKEREACSSETERTSLEPPHLSNP